MCNDGPDTVIFDGMSSNPRDYEVMNGMELYESGVCDPCSRRALEGRLDIGRK